jgi:hypothetical protein
MGSFYDTKSQNATNSLILLVRLIAEMTGAAILGDAVAKNDNICGLTAEC